ncbi:MAG: ATPase [Treponema sp.]|jgi:vacuolar-type H+-ATPase subunit E/Vma4|nr:ATPase [Treponema sp.]
MEELQSAEVLHREILEDARKKAYRILKTADESVQAGAEAWEKKTGDAIREARELYAKRVFILQEELKARLVLDKQRIRSEKIEGLLKSAMETYLLSLNRETLLSILERTLHKQLEELRETGELPGSDIKVRYNKVADTELEDILSGQLPKGSWTKIPGNAGFIGEAIFPAIILDAPAVRILASIQAVTENVLEDKRAELVASLFGEEALLEGGAV